MSSSFNEIQEKIVKTRKEFIKSTNSKNYNCLLGKIHENVIRDETRRILHYLCGSKYSVFVGVAKKGNLMSKELDFILVENDKGDIICSYGEFAVVPLEIIKCVGEIKGSLTKRALFSANKNLHSAKDISYSIKTFIIGITRYLKEQNIQNRVANKSHINKYFYLANRNDKLKPNGFKEFIDFLII